MGSIIGLMVGGIRGSCLGCLLMGGPGGLGGWSGLGVFGRDEGEEKGRRKGEEKGKEGRY